MSKYALRFAQAKRSRVFHLLSDVWPEKTFCSRKHRNWNEQACPPDSARLCRQCRRTLKKERVVWQRLELEEQAAHETNQ